MLRIKILVKPRLQVKYLIIMLVIIIITAVAIYFTLFDAFFRSPLIYQISMGEIEKIKMEYTQNFLIAVMIIVLAIGLQSSLFFHRIAGPIYVFEKVISMISEGKLLKDFKIRKTDELKDLANEIQHMCDCFREYIQSDRIKIEEIKTLLNDVVSKYEISPNDRVKLKRIEDLLSELTQQFKI